MTKIFNKFLTNHKNTFLKLRYTSLNLSFLCNRIYIRPTELRRQKKKKKNVKKLGELAQSSSNCTCGEYVYSRNWSASINFHR